MCFLYKCMPVLCPPHAESWLIGKDSDAGRDWGQEEKAMTEEEMVGWHHWLDGHEFEWTPGVGDGQGGLACCDSWGRKESDTTERLNLTELNCLPVYESPSSSGFNLTLKPSIHHVKCQAAWITSWNQDSREKYQLPQICRWCHTNAESEEKLKSLLMRVKEEWKNWFKTQH